MRDIYLEACTRIRELRNRRGYSVEQLAEKSNISTKFLYEIETGKKGFSAKVLCNMAMALNVSCDYIIRGKEENSSNSINEALKYLNDYQIKIVENIVINIVDMMKEK